MPSKDHQPSSEGLRGGTERRRGHRLKRAALRGIGVVAASAVALGAAGCGPEDEEARFGDQPEERSEEVLGSADTPEARDDELINFNQLELSPDVFSNPAKVSLDSESTTHPVGTAIHYEESGWVVYIGQPYDITHEVYGENPEPSQEGRAVLGAPVGMIFVGEPDAWGKPLNTSTPNIGIVNYHGAYRSEVHPDEYSNPFLIDPASFDETATVLDAAPATEYDSDGNIANPDSIVSGVMAYPVDKKILLDNDIVIVVENSFTDRQRIDQAYAEMFVWAGELNAQAASAQEEPSGETASDSRPESSRDSPEHTEELSGWKIGTTGEIIRGQEADDKVKEILGDFPIPNLDPGYEFGVVRVDVANPEGTAQEGDFFEGVNPQIIDENNDNQVGHENRMLIPHSAYPSPEDRDDQSRDIIFILESKMLRDNPKLVLIVQAQGEHVKLPLE